ncbi:GNAT family N-acetyltransferase [Rhodocaloribacter litoris]|uniref:GNAT family N-acetyltransferase n=1 Tax=Rhodocaloribacter litoris TaxID=2558931 RepID=UPI001423AE59|nr:GNAT family N-acetyltransferase [Rhodocaloribacter litoris]QXD14429.1 GNAT family N-acetyltransferase [Rhodocaloribacter litoris]
MQHLQHLAAGDGRNDIPTAPFLRLEPVHLGHAPAIQRLAADPAVTATTNLPEPYPPDGALHWIRYLLPKRQAGVEYAFVLLDARDEVVGVNGFVEVRREEGWAELGYWIGRPYWGRGYATAGGRLLLNFGFGELGLHSVVARPLVRNRASCRVLEKLGFRFVETQRNVFPKFHPDDLLAVYEMTAGEWAALP